MNKRVKIVATLGPTVEIRGGKNSVVTGYFPGWKNGVEASAENIAQLIEAGANTHFFSLVTTKNKAVWQLLNSRKTCR